MTPFWNSGQRESTTGLDILGVRQFDRALEQRLVAGITTISFRARYMSLLPWLVVEFWQREAKAGGGNATFNWERFEAAQQRMEFITLACTALGSPQGSQGVLGADIFADQIAALRAGQVASLPSGRSGRTYGTYIMPCRSFGILQTTSDETLPIQVLPRGAALHEARASACVGSQLVELVFIGGNVNPEMVRGQAHLFSVDAIAGVPDEQRLLTEAMRQSYSDQPAVLSRYERFRATTAWLFAQVDQKPAYSTSLIAEAYANVVRGATENAVLISWAEFELRRRVHFCFELLLSAIAAGLIETNDRTLEGVLSSWAERQQPPDLFRALLGPEQVQYGMTMGDLNARVEGGAYLDRSLATQPFRELSPPFKCLAAIALLVALDQQTANLREAGTLLNRDHDMERAFRILGDCRGGTLRECALALLRFAAERHLATTFRKMGQGQKCSLRFYPERGRLVPTGLAVSPGYSGDRLGNVMNMWADVGLLERTPTGNRVSEAGRAAIAAGAFSA